MGPTGEIRPTFRRLKNSIAVRGVEEEANSYPNNLGNIYQTVLFSFKKMKQFYCVLNGATKIKTQLFDGLPLKNGTRSRY